MRLFLIPLLLSSVLASGACSEAQEYEAKVGLEEGAGSTTDRSVAATANDTDAEPGAVELENERVEFSHIWPAAANAIPKLAARFESEAQTALGEMMGYDLCISFLSFWIKLLKGLAGSLMEQLLLRFE